MCKGISFSFWSILTVSPFVYLGPLFDPFKVEASLPPTNEVWGKVIFLHLFVILFTGGQPGPGVGVPDPGEVCSRGSMVWGVPGPGGSAPEGCLVPGVPGPRGCLSWGGLLQGGLPAPGGCLVEIHRTATAAGGTHPTGMHSCLTFANESLQYLYWVLRSFGPGHIKKMKTVKFRIDFVFQLRFLKCSRSSTD